MRNLKKSLVLLLALALLPIGAFAARKVRLPQGPRDYVQNACEGGSDYFRESNATESLVCTGHCVLCGIIMSTGANTTRLIIRNTGTADSGTVLDGATAIGPIYFRVLDTESSRNRWLARPMIFDSGGISVTVDSVGSGEWAVLQYLDLDEQ